MSFRWCGVVGVLPPPGGGGPWPQIIIVRRRARRVSGGRSVDGGLRDRAGGDEGADVADDAAGLEDQLVELPAVGVGAGDVDGGHLPLGGVGGADPLALEIDRDGVLAA